MPAWKSRIALVATAALLFTGFTAASSASAATTPLIDVDGLISVTPSSGFASAVGEGHLLLNKQKGTTWTGTFVDDMGAAKSYPASAKNVVSGTQQGTYTVKTHNGTFVFPYGTSSAGGKAPSSYGKGATVAFRGSAHKYTRQPTLPVSTTSQIGYHRATVTGTLSLWTDALGYVVPYSAKHKTLTTYAWKTTGKTTKSKITSWGIYSPSDGAGHGFLQIALPQGSTVWEVTAQENDEEPGYPLLGSALTGSGAKFTRGTFTGELLFT